MAALDKIGAFYGIEDENRGEPADARRTARQHRTKPIVEALKTRLGGQLPKLPRASETAKAINYGLNHWDGLTRFLDDYRIEIDTNTGEQISNGNVLGSELLWCPVGERRMRTHAIVVGAPFVEHGAGLRQGYEQRLIEALGSMEQAHHYAQVTDLQPGRQSAWLTVCR